MAETDAQRAIEGEVLGAQELQLQLDKMESDLQANEEFKQFIELRNTVNKKWTEVRKNIEEVMVPAYKAGKVNKTINGDWGSVTVVESDRFEIDESLLPSKFFKKVVDETKIRATFQLEGKPPKGTKQFKKYGVMLRVKLNGEQG